MRLGLRNYALALILALAFGCAVDESGNEIAAESKNWVEAPNEFMICGHYAHGNLSIGYASKPNFQLIIRNEVAVLEKFSVTSRCYDEGDVEQRHYFINAKNERMAQILMLKSNPTLGKLIWRENLSWCSYFPHVIDNWQSCRITNDKKLGALVSGVKKSIDLRNYGNRDEHSLEPLSEEEQRNISICRWGSFPAPNECIEEDD